MTSCHNRGLVPQQDASFKTASAPLRFLSLRRIKSNARRSLVGSIPPLTPHCLRLIRSTHWLNCTQIFPNFLVRVGAQLDVIGIQNSPKNSRPWLAVVDNKSCKVVGRRVFYKTTNGKQHASSDPSFGSTWHFSTCKISDFPCRTVSSLGAVSLLQRGIWQPIEQPPSPSETRRFAGLFDWSEFPEEHPEQIIEKLIKIDKNSNLWPFDKSHENIMYSGPSYRCTNHAPIPDLIVIHNWLKTLFLDPIHSTNYIPACIRQPDRCSYWLAQSIV